MNFNVMSKQRKFLLVSAVVGFVSMFLPWVTITIFGYAQSANGMHREGIVVFLCFLVAGVIASTGDQKKNLDRPMWTISLIAGILALLLTAWYFSQIVGSATGGGFPQFGIYIAAVAAIGVLLSTYLFRLPVVNVSKEQDGLRDTMRSSFTGHTENMGDEGTRVTGSIDRNSPGR